MEKENEDQMKEAAQMLNANNDEDNGRRRRQSSDFNIPNNQNLLAQISSTGVLLKPLDTAQSTLDYVFVLNVRESELYPPLFLKDDIKCLEDKLAVYKDEFTSGNNIRSSFRLFERSLIYSCSCLSSIFIFNFQNMPEIMWNWLKNSSSKSV